MEVLVLDGKNYVKVSKAAKDLGYATDYVGQLCRSGKVDAHLIGRTWYVNQDDLSTHRVEKKRMSRIKAREQAKRSIEEHRTKIKEPQNNYRNIAIQYEEDSSELIPKTKKLTVDSERFVVAPSDDTPETFIENKGEKVVMTGELHVVDVTDGPIDTDTIILRPSHIRKSPKEKVIDAEGVAGDSISEVKNETNEIRLSFEEKLESFDMSTVANGLPVTESVPHASHDDDQDDSSISGNQKKTDSSIGVFLFLTILLCAVASTVLLSSVIDYSYENPDQVVNSFTFSLEKTINIISIKI